jgi:hypothetical protein
MSKYLNVLLLICGVAEMSVAKAETLFGVSHNNFLVSFDSANPSTVDFIDPVTGLASGERIASLSYNAAENLVFALGYNPRMRSGNLYQLNLADGVAAPFRSVGSFPVALSPTFTFASAATGTEYLVSSNRLNTILYTVDPKDFSVTPIGSFARGRPAFERAHRGARAGTFRSFTSWSDGTCDRLIDQSVTQVYEPT